MLIRYGYVTNTKIKFVVVVESANNLLRDNEIRMVSINWYGAWCIVIWHELPLAKGGLGACPPEYSRISEMGFPAFCEHFWAKSNGINPTETKSSVIPRHNITCLAEWNFALKDLQSRKKRTDSFPKYQTHAWKFKFQKQLAIEIRLISGSSHLYVNVSKKYEYVIIRRKSEARGIKHRTQR